MHHLNIAFVLAFASALTACSSGGSSGSGAPQPPDHPVTPPSAVFVLGDSLSDVGNAAAAADYLLNLLASPPTVGLCNPADVLVLHRPCDDLFYRQSRVSNGPVAVEYLAANFGLAELLPSMHVVPSRPVAGTDYAVAGAKAREQGEGDLSRQVDMLLLDHGLPLPADALYVMMIGGNDAIDALQAIAPNTPDAQQISAAIVTDAVAAIASNLERLLNAGARRLMVANVPDLSALPAVLADSHASGDETAMLGAAAGISQAFDSELNARLDQIENSGQWSAPTALSLARFDLRAALQTAEDAAAARGSNVVDACFDSSLYRQSSTAERVFHPDCAPVAGGAPRFSNFAFWDDIHPTGSTHAAIGASLVSAVPP